MQIQACLDYLERLPVLPHFRACPLFEVASAPTLPDPMEDVNILAEDTARNRSCLVFIEAQNG
jgi:hypothetical protein